MFKDGILFTLPGRPDPLKSYIAMELIKDLDDGNEIDNFLNTPKEDLICYHHTLGRHIRNVYIYPDKSFMEPYPDEHPDDISFEMIESLYDLLLALKKDVDDLSIYGKEREIFER